MGKPSKADFIVAARTMQEYCFSRETGCTGCLFSKLDECGVQEWDLTDAPDNSAESVEEPPDNVNHPAHYCMGRIETIEAIEVALGADGFRAYCAGNVLKYVWRYRYKGGVEDLKKARWYLDRLVAVAKNATTGERGGE